MYDQYYPETTFRIIIFYICVLILSINAFVSKTSTDADLILKISIVPVSIMFILYISHQIVVHDRVIYKDKIQRIMSENNNQIKILGNDNIILKLEGSELKMMIYDITVETLDLNKAKRDIQFKEKWNDDIIRYLKEYDNKKGD